MRSRLSPNSGLALGCAHRATLHFALIGLIASPLPAPSATIQSVVTALDSTQVHQRAEGNHQLKVTVGRPNSDSWCSVEVTAPSNVEYIWLKDVSTPNARRVYGAKYFTSKETPPPQAVLQQQLKVGYQVKPLSYSKEAGLYEGSAFIVR
jgi:hypothetical protein